MADVMNLDSSVTLITNPKKRARQLTNDHLCRISRNWTGVAGSAGTSLVCTVVEKLYKTQVVD